ncbi:MAG: secretin and TonB N-terminal domain-containing protein [Armatimonadota bacterium]
MIVPASRVYRLFLVTVMLAAVVACTAAPGGRKLDQLNFVNAEIPVVLKSVAELSGSNIVVAPTVKGQVTLNVKDVTVDEALDIICKMSGLSYQYANNTYLVSLMDTNAKPAESLIPSAYQIYRLRTLSAADATGSLAITFKDVQARALQDNRLVLSGSEERVQAAKAFLLEIDPAENKSESAEVGYTVKSLIPWQAKSYLEQLFGTRGLTVAYAPKQSWDKGKVLAGAAPAGGTATPTLWESNNLILRGPKVIVDQAIASLAKVDLDVPMTDARCSVKRVTATQAIRHLLERFEARGLTIYTAPMTNNENIAAASKQASIGGLVVREADGKLNVSDPLGDFILHGPVAVVKEAVAALPIIDVGPEKVRHAYTVKFILAEEAKKKLDEAYLKDGLQVIIAPANRGVTPAMATNEAASASSADSSKIATESNKLELAGPSTVVLAAENSLAAWDTQPPQIEIKAEMVSINSSDITNLGITWGGVIGGKTTVGSVGVGLHESANTDPLKLGRIFRDPLDLSATINALQTQNKAKVINRPDIVVQNGQEATIHVGGKFFYEKLTGYTQQGPTVTTESVDTGVTLKVKPRLSSDGVITLEITSNVTDEPIFRTSSSGLDLPEFRINSTATVVPVRDGETLVIGGLMQTRREEVTTSVPVLGKIPLIGALFRSKKTSPSQTDLVIMVTPRVLRPAGTTTPATATPPAAQ